MTDLQLKPVSLRLGIGVIAHHFDQVRAELLMKFEGSLGVAFSGEFLEAEVVVEREGWTVNLGSLQNPIDPGLSGQKGFLSGT